MIEIQSPTRVDLAGGTLDCWPLHLFVGDCVTVNLAINIMTGCRLSVRSDKKICVHIKDLNFKYDFDDLEKAITSDHNELTLLKYLLEYFKPEVGLDITTFSQSPVGGGLGGSSSLTISIIKAFHRLMNVSMQTREMVELAHNLEAKVIKNPTGTQDYYPAINGGLNIIHYTANGSSLESLGDKYEPLMKNLLLVYTGRSHHSGINNWQVIKSVIEGDGHTLGALKEIAQISKVTAETCRAAKWQDLPSLFRAEFDSRIKLTKSFSSPEIEKLKSLSMNDGAEALKICGAGGGGCVLIWALPEFHERISNTCRKNGFQPLEIALAPIQQGP